MSNDRDRELCREVEENIASLLNGDVEPRLLEHIAGCDRCRDLRYDAIQAVEVVQDAASDYEHAADFEEQLLRRIDAGDKPKVEKASSDVSPTAATAPVKTSVVVRS